MDEDRQRLMEYDPIEDIIKEDKKKHLTIQEKLHYLKVCGGATTY